MSVEYILSIAGVFTVAHIYIYIPQHPSPWPSPLASPNFAGHRPRSHPLRSAAAILPSMIWRRTVSSACARRNAPGASATTDEPRMCQGDGRWKILGWILIGFLDDHLRFIRLWERFNEFDPDFDPIWEGKHPKHQQWRQNGKTSSIWLQYQKPKQDEDFNQRKYGRNSSLATGPKTPEIPQWNLTKAHSMATAKI